MAWGALFGGGVASGALFAGGVKVDGRRAMSPEAAIEELRANAGTQFEPRIVTAVISVVENGLVEETEAYNDAVRAVLATHPTPPRLELSA